MINIALAIIIVLGLRTINSKKAKLSITFLTTTFALSNIFIGYILFKSIMGSGIFLVLGYFILIIFIKLFNRNKILIYMVFLVSNILAVTVLLNDLYEFLPKSHYVKIINQYSYVFTIMYLSFAYIFVYLKINFYKKNKDFETKKSILENHNKKLKKIEKIKSTS
ncbi:MAG: hypothetical protein ABF289_07595 [Clostridiales bacterium]